ncbi:MAG: AraC family transcriptional regulator [Bacteroidales bacterium]|jgi:AraC-like DNA-binding protein|nr:AraC family transcriptional regulator [Bacteroidales bacterium]
MQHIKGPSVMADLFTRMPLDNRELFVIRKLNVLGSKKEFPSPLIRSAIHCFFFIIKGEALILVGDKSYLFKENECAIVPAGQMFSVRYYNDCIGYMGGFHTDFLNVDSENNNLLRTFGFLRRWSDHKVFFDQAHGNYVRYIFERLCVENEGKKSKHVIKAYLTALLVEIDEVYRKSTDLEDIEVDNRLCNDFVEMVFEQADQSLSIAYYAEKLNITPAHLHKIVKRFTGKTPLSWINEAVLLEAKVMLCHTDMSVNDIAGKVGLQDASYFSRLFKKQVGMTPIAFRNEVKYPKKG